MILKGGTTQACAACKYQRRKCTPECLLAPYFPADQPKVFRNVHKLFGVSNIVKILKALEPGQKKIAMESLICEANIRDKYPVHGCCEEISCLRYQIWQMEEELHIVQQQLEIYRQHHHHTGSSVPDDVTLPLFNHTPNPDTYPTMAALPISQQHSYSNSNSVAYNSLYMDPKDNVQNHLWVQHSYAENNSNSMAMQSQLVASQPLANQQGNVEDYDEMHPFFDTIDDRQSYIYSKEAYESSSEESLKDNRKCIEHVAENELKSAAACFSLTSVTYFTDFVVIPSHGSLPGGGCSVTLITEKDNMRIPRCFSTNLLSQQLTRTQQIASTDKEVVKLAFLGFQTVKKQ